MAAQTYRAACTVKNGRTYYGKARAKCKKCGRQFVLVRQHAPLSNEQKRRIELLLADRISLEGISRVLDIKAHQLYAYMDELYAKIPIDLAVPIRQPVDIELVCLE